MARKKRLMITSKMANRKVSAAIFIIVVVAIIAIPFINLGGITGYSISANRPKYCIENKCAPDYIFQNLPPYPDDFSAVDLLVESSALAVAENFTPGLPDENYFKQPGFYPNWETQGLQFYLRLADPVFSYDYLGTIGYGAYPGDVVIQGQGDYTVRPGMDLLAVTYFYASWGVKNYQGLKLVTTYPSEGITRAGYIDVKQDPSSAREYFDVRIDPDLFLLEPSFKKNQRGSFAENWASKVRVFIHVKENTPPGWYIIGIRAVSPPPLKEQEWLTQYRFRYMSVGGLATERPPYRIFVEVS